MGHGGVASSPARADPEYEYVNGGSAEPHAVERGGPMQWIAATWRGARPNRAINFEASPNQKFDVHTQYTLACTAKI